MEDRRYALVRHIFKILTRDGFRVSNPDLGGLVSFDLIAKRERMKFIIKVLQNIDTFRGSNAEEMIRISKLTYSAPLVIGEKAGSGPLERNVVYYRHHIPILSPESFSDYIEGDRPCISSGPGGFYVSMDVDLLHRRREELGFSIGYLSNKIGTSRRSISLYESGGAVTIDVFLKLEKILNRDISRAIDLLEIATRLEMPVEDSSVENEFLKEVISIMMNQGFDFHTIKKSPFDAIARESMEESFLIGLLESLSEKIERISAMKNISQIFENEAFIISHSSTEKEAIGGCPVVNLSELRNIGEVERLQRLIEKRKIA